MTPIKRHDTLKNLSREHHQGLMLCWKIRQGLLKKVDLKRIRKYCRYFFDTHLIHHFREEEKLIFPLLGNEHPIIQKALEDHKKLHQSFTQEDDDEKALHSIIENLEKHIRFEERELFNLIQEQVSEEKLLEAAARLREDNEVSEEWEDQFWK